MTDLSHVTEHTNVQYREHTQSVLYTLGVQDLVELNKSCHAELIWNLFFSCFPESWGMGVHGSHFSSVFHFVFLLFLL